MSYLEQLKSENGHPEALPKLSKGGSGSFGSTGERDFPEKKAPVAVVDLATPDGPRITEATIYQGRPTAEAVDLADAMLAFIANQAGPVPEADVLAAVGGDPVLSRNVLNRLAVDGIAEALPGGLFGIPAYPPKPANLPEGCPLLGPGPHPAGCRFHPTLFARLLDEGALPLSGGRCPLRQICQVGEERFPGSWTKSG